MKTTLHKTWLTLSTLLIGIALIAGGCAGQSGNSPADSSPPPIAAPENSPSPDSSDSDDADVPETNQPNDEESDSSQQDNPYLVAGIEDPQQFEQYFNDLKKLAAADDKEKLADYVIYPMKLFIAAQEEQIQDRDAFIANYERIFTEAIKELLQNEQLEDLFVNYQGIGIGGGAIWLGVDENARIGIITVNQISAAN